MDLLFHLLRRQKKVIKIFITKGFITEWLSKVLPWRTVKNLYRAALYRNQITVRVVSPTTPGHVDQTDFSGQHQAHKGGQISSVTQTRYAINTLKVMATLHFRVDFSGHSER